MASYSIPNSILAIGRTSTLSSQRSRKQSRPPARFSKSVTLAHAVAGWPKGFFKAKRSAFNAQRRIKSVGHRILAIDYWAFLFWRVKGAWWSSRSSKPLSVPHTRGRGRFDSYPLRISSFDLQFTTLNSADSPSIIFPDNNSKIHISERR